MTAEHYLAAMADVALVVWDIDSIMTLISLNYLDWIVCVPVAASESPTTGEVESEPVTC